MATQLKKTTYQVKRFFLYFALFVVIVFFIDYIFRGGIIEPPVDPVWDPNYPKPDNFMKLIPKPQITSINATTGNAGIVSKKPLAFPTAPAIPPVVYVYKINAEREFLNDDKLGKDAAAALGLPSDYSVLNNVMNWESEDGNKTFIFDRFQRYYKFRINQLPLTTMITTDKDTAIQKAMAVLQLLKIQDDLLDARSSYADLAFRAPDGSLTTKTENYNCVKVALNKNIKLIDPITNKIDATYATIRRFSYNKGIGTLLLKEYTKKTQELLTDLIELEFKSLTYEKELNTNEYIRGIYQIMTPDEAFQELEVNRGFLYRLHLVGDNYLANDQLKFEVASYVVDPTLTKIIYIEPDNRNPEIPWTTYLQPYYLFEGTATTATTKKELAFSFIVPALIPDSYQ